MSAKGAKLEGSISLNQRAINKLRNDSNQQQLYESLLLQSQKKTDDVTIDNLRNIYLQAVDDYNKYK